MIARRWQASDVASAPSGGERVGSLWPHDTQPRPLFAEIVNLYFVHEKDLAAQIAGQSLALAGRGQQEQIIAAGDDGKDKENTRGGAGQHRDRALPWAQDRDVVAGHALEKVVAVGVGEAQYARIGPTPRAPRR